MLMDDAYTSSPAATDAAVAYFSMEIALEPRIPSYSGGLGVLAGDTVRAAADLRVPMVAVTLLYRNGFFRQTLDASGQQSQWPQPWPVEKLVSEMTARAAVDIEGRPVNLRAWKFEVRSATGFIVPVLFLDADLPENAEPDRTLTDHLYGGDMRYRFCQEVILGIGGVRMLRSAKP
jgi:glycogen phosphorylase